MSSKAEIVRWEINLNTPFSESDSSEDEKPKSNESEEDCAMTMDDEEWPKYPEIKLNLKPRTSEIKEHITDLVPAEEKLEKKSFFGSVLGKVKNIFEKKEKEKEDFDNIFEDTPEEKEKKD